MGMASLSHDTMKNMCRLNHFICGNLWALVLILAVVVCEGCSRGGGVQPGERETILRPGMKVSLHRNSPTEELQVSCPDAGKRRVAIGKDSHAFSVKGRASRWFGSFGVYADKSANIFRSKVFFYEEGLQHFSCLKDAQAWVEQQKSFSRVYSNGEGLIISLCEGDKLEIRLWQIFINGVSPKGFPESTKDIKLSDAVEYNILNDFKPSEPKLVEGILFSGRVQDLMKEGNIAFEQVLDAIEHGAVNTLPDGRVIYEYGPKVPKYDFINPFHSIRVYMSADGQVEYLRSEQR